MFDKIKFWKKQNPLNDLPDSLGGEFEANPLDSSFSASTQPQEFQSPPTIPENDNTLSNNVPNTISPQNNIIHHEMINPQNSTHNTPNIELKLEMVGKDLEIVSSKIDTLKASIENLNQRLKNIENKW